MKVHIEEDEGILIIRPVGRVDAITAPALDESVVAALKDGPSRVVIDMIDVPYISSAGLRVFIRAGKQVMQTGKLAACRLDANVKQVFELAGFDKIMALCEDLGSAKQQVSS